MSKHGKATEVNPNRKSGVESLRWLAVNFDILLAAPAVKLAPNVMPCIPLDLVGAAERGPCCPGNARPPYNTVQGCAPKRSLRSHHWPSGELLPSPPTTNLRRHMIRQSHQRRHAGWSNPTPWACVSFYVSVGRDGWDMCTKWRMSCAASWPKDFAQ